MEGKIILTTEDDFGTVIWRASPDIQEKIIKSFQFRDPRMSDEEVIKMVEKYGAHIVNKFFSLFCFSLTSKTAIEDMTIKIIGSLGQCFIDCKETAKAHAKSL